MALNSAPGSQKRCIDTSTGGFVTTECCAQVCDAADWRTQANGTVCAWQDDPGIEGAAAGQFAPRMCCELNDRMRCERAEMDGGACKDPESGRTVQQVCCSAEAADCHPWIANGLSSCVRELSELAQETLYAPPESWLELLDTCSTDSDSVEDMIDELCGRKPSLTFCAGLPLEEVVTQFVQPCYEEVALEVDCVFGQYYGDIFHSSRLLIAEDKTITIADLPSLSPQERAQVLAAAQECDTVTTMHTTGETRRTRRAATSSKP